ncbi:MAG: helix-turn-helix domain-containing protein [Acidobacteriota bacterium]|nr:helix-turn-helix domain-containing protein [Acidobacteriota bacterium]
MQKEIGMALGGRLKDLRLAHGLTLESLSSRLGDHGVEVSEATLHRAEKGTCMLRLDTARAVFNCLGVSLGYVDEVIAEAQVREDVDLSGRSFDDLMREGRELLEYGDYRSALDRFKAAQQWSALAEDDDPERLALALISEADCQRRLRRFQLSEIALRRVLNLPGAPEERRLQAALFQVNLGYASGDFFSARLHAKHVEPLLAACDGRFAAQGYAIIGNLFVAQKAWADAVPRLEKAKQAFEREGLDVQANQVRIHLGLCFFKTGHRESGRRMVNRALDEARSGEKMVVVLSALRVLGEMAAEEGGIDRARREYSAAASLARKLRLENEEFEVCFRIWRLEVSAGDRVDLERMARRALQRLVKKVDRALPEVKEYVARIKLEAKEAGQ